MLPQPAVIAHRGASAFAPENTLAAFELAIEQYADGIELDVKLTSDGHVVVIHDATINRTTNGSGKVSDISLEEVRELDAGSWFDNKFLGERIPTLDEVFKHIGGKTIINVELTNYYSNPFNALPEKVVTLVQKYGLEEQVLLSSFNPIALRRTRHLLPQVPIGLLALPGLGGAWARGFTGGLINHQALHPEHNDVTLNLIARSHRKGRCVLTWTVNHENDMQRLFLLGIDGIITDYPLLARQVITETAS
jgi:glycerophosphoryl diester phosphodiesterase